MMKHLTSRIGARTALLVGGNRVEQWWQEDELTKLATTAEALP